MDTQGAADGVPATLNYLAPGPRESIELRTVACLF
jgi:hypothetical protein